MARRTGLIRSHLTQALEILETEKEIVPDTEIPASDASDVSEVSISNKPKEHVKIRCGNSVTYPHQINTFGFYTIIGLY